MVRLVLQIAKGPGSGRALVIAPGERRLVGRAPNADLRVTSDEYMSDLHVAVEVDEGGAARAEDLCSSNGTRLNGASVDKAKLNEGDTLTVGSTEIVVRFERAEEGPSSAARLGLPSDPLVERLIAIIRRDNAKELAAWDPGDERLRVVIAEGLSKAASYGVEDEADLVRYVKLMAILGPSFDEDATLPWAGEILRRKAVGSPRKLDAIKEHIATRYGRIV